MNNVAERLGYEVELRVEGRARFYAPKLPGEKSYAPTGLPVFFNPVSKPNRDIAVLFVKSFFRGRSIRACEPLAGTGIRSIRLVLETDDVEEVVANDISRKAYDLIELNAELNRVRDKVKPRNLDANELLAMSGRGRPRYDYVDIDPAGSPAAFLENGFRGCGKGGVLAATATDMSALTGAKPESCLRKYGVRVVKVPFSKEVALRILAGFMVRTAARLGLAATPILSFQKDHYIKVFVRVERGILKARERLRDVGWISYCERCLKIYPVGYEYAPITRCDECGSIIDFIGPLWTGELTKSGIAAEIYGEALKEPGLYRESLKLLEALKMEEWELMGYYPVNYVAERLKQSPIKPKKLIEELHSMGYRASITHIDPGGFKTDAPFKVVAGLFKELRFKD